MLKIPKYKFLRIFFFLFIFLLLIDVSMAGSYGAGPYGSGEYGVGLAPSVGPTTTGGGSSGSSTSQPTEYTARKIHSWTEITPDKPVIFKEFDKNTGISQIQIQVKEKAQDVKVTVNSYDAKPSGVSIEKPGKTYKYIQIETENLEDKLNKTIITFQVDKSWVENNSLQKENISVYRFNTSIEIWDELNTTFTEQNNSSYYYDVELTNFSYFAIGEKTIAEEEMPVSEEEKEIRTSNFLQENYWIGLIIIGALIIALIVIKRKVILFGIEILKYKLRRVPDNQS
jgi:PGF-pre-PGF domain-containing protein